MKLLTEQNTIERSGTFKEKKFTIKSSAKAFEILSSQLYQDGITAIIRELSTNAVDAHIEAGQTKPFDVHLPNFLEPYFEIRDYGTGLSPEKVKEVYTTYFESTRNDSNDYVGALGLGSKSPFAYTDMFTVTSFYNGKAYTYSAFRDEDGEPSIALLNTTNSDEPNGLKINLDVRSSDIHLFATKAQAVYYWFEQKPNIVGANLNVEPREIVMSGNHWLIEKELDYSYRRFIQVVMGNVAYPLIDMLPHEFNLMNCRLILKVPIGSIAITPSRESIKLNTQTVSYLENRIKEVGLEIQNEIENKTFDTKFEKASFVKKAASIYKIKNNHHDIKGYCDHYKIITPRRLRTSIKFEHVEEYINIDISRNNLFIENDIGELTLGWSRRLSRFIKNTPENVKYYLANVYNREEFTKTFGEPTLKLSSIPKIPVKRGGKRPPPALLVFRRGWVNEVDTSTINTGFITKIYRGKTLINGKEVSSYHMSTLEAIIKEPIYGIQEKQYEKAKRVFKLKDLEEELRTLATNNVNSMTEYERAVYHYGKPYNCFIGLLPRNLSTLCDDFITFMSTFLKDDVIIPIQLTGTKVPSPARNFATEFFKQYPLLQSQTHQSVSEYIKLKDQQ